MSKIRGAVHYIAQTGPLYTVGYYNNDSGCSMQLSTTGGDYGADACNNMTLEDGTTISNSNSSVGTTNEPIEHIACELSWYVYRGFSSTGANVKIVAHSMGGLIVRYMIQKAGQDSHFAPYVDVSDVVHSLHPWVG